MDDGVVILGAGLAGLSAAYHAGKGCTVFEAADVPGGLLYTRTVDGYSFDYTGHLLHLKDGYVRSLVAGLLKGNLAEHIRRAVVHVDGVFVEYPFQANTYGLPEQTARECVEGFIGAPGRADGGGKPANFEDWITHNFGDGIARHFMLPYNRKLWRYPLTEMSVSGIAPFVPVPTVEDVKKGASREGAKGLGYNSSFFYPKRGGIYSLVEALLPHVRDLSLGQRAVEVDAEKKTVSFATGYKAWYGRLISTMPLPELVGIIKDAPREMKDAAARLRYVSVCDIDLGVERDGICPYHWIYFPGPRFAFYRAGFLSNFSERMAPPGCSSMYVEVSHLPEDACPEGLAVRAKEGLIACGLLRADDRIAVEKVSDIRYAYTVSDAHSERWVPAIMEYLGSKGIQSIGRYGAWEYSSMEDAILEGRRAAAAAAAA